MQTDLTDQKNNRIWEFDFARGIAIICVCLVHFFAFADEFGAYNITWTPFFDFVKQDGGTFFFILSGACCSLSEKKHTARALAVLACAFALTAASVVLYKTGNEDATILIQWGVLHTLGLSMLIYPIFRKWPDWLVLLVGAAAIAFGYWAYFSFRIRNEWLFIFGFRSYDFRSFDYFPIFPYLGWYLTGSGLCRLIYKDKHTHFDYPIQNSVFFRFARWCGRHSLLIYMIQLPAFYILFKFILCK